ncbi:hypothetical protein VH570_06485 [Sphingobium sp. HT1-2]|uniref:hypothetical protein n=1 Tax=Sphingobium sp. HT1-2 TaxID=3111640 RepID=UPI003C10D855
MTAIYDRARDTVGRSLRKFGGQATITRKTGGVYDPSTGAVTGGEETFPANVVIRTNRVWTAQGVVGSETVATMMVEPKVGDIISLADQTWRVTEVEIVAPDGAAILYKARVTAG